MSAEELPMGLKLEEVDSLESNYYDPARNTIVLDKRLNNYPELRKFVLDHEIRHAVIERDSNSRLESTVRNLAFDIKHDFNRIMNRYELAETDDKYLHLEKERPRMNYLHYTLMNGFRMLSYAIMFGFLMPFLAWREIFRDWRDYYGRRD